ncbi:siderophore-interacting protein [Halomonas daqingensis]|uniref:Siderophore-interacting protein n=1 Tax=Billgrantia desiderata TaxID=52021 RepID=A0ABS9B8B0_9GAMM|nr:siderophore-interacting protein [Halomonas desiderata]MCE8043409.1 siderophore-interacting protein [Halomonas desiderata]MCE8047984.1 siderophore-interacting protein [Halomonas desiderata]
MTSSQHRPLPSHRTSRNPLARLLAKHFSHGVVTEVEDVTPSMRRIRIASEALGELSYIPGQYVRIEINDPLSLYGILRPAETLRTYTIWHYSREDQYIDLCVHLYRGDGIGVEWAKRTSPGETVTFWGPQGDFVPQAADYHLFIGEETATVAFAAMIAAMPAEARLYGVLESANAGEELPLPDSGALLRVHRNGGSPVASTTLLVALAELDLPGQPGFAYIAGEARTCQLARHHLIEERGWPRDAIRTKPFWALGKRGLH